MGTRNLTCVMQNGDYKIAQYGQWGGHPEGSGLIVLDFLKSVDLAKFEEQVKKVRFITDSKWQEIFDKHSDNGSIYLFSAQENYWKTKLAHLDRDMGVNILKYVYDTPNPEPLLNDLDFAGNSLFCEWAYVIDLDKKSFEVYEGFNKQKLSADERFANIEKDHGDYEPIRLAKSYLLNDLPSRDDFLKDLTTNTK